MQTGNTIELLSCGHTVSEHGTCTTGYATVDHGEPTERKICYQCAAIVDIEFMVSKGVNTLYLSVGDKPYRYERTDGGVSEGTNRTKCVTNWTSDFTLWVEYYKQSNMFVPGVWSRVQRTDVWFYLDGFEWHGVNRGDMDICRVKRTKRKVGYGVKSDGVISRLRRLADERTARELSEVTNDVK